MGLNKVGSKVFIRLSENLFRCKKHDVNFQITKTLIEHIDEFPDIYIEEIAYGAQTTPASVTKFCKKLGYASFKEMRYDLDVYSNDLMMDQFYLASSQEAYVEAILQREYEINKHIFASFDVPQLQRIAKKVKGAKKLAIFGNSYSFTGVNFFRELLSQEGYIVFESNRSAEDQLVESILAECDGAFIISLTGEWAEAHVPLIQRQGIPLFLFTQREPTEFAAGFDEIITFNMFDFLLRSNYYSQKVLHLWTMDLVLQLKQNHDAIAD